MPNSGLLDSNQRLFYIFQEGVIDLATKPQREAVDRTLADITRSGLAWLHRGIYVGVIRTGPFGRYRKSLRANKARKWHWYWRVWNPGSHTGGRELDVRIPPITRVNDLLALAEQHVHAYVGGLLSACQLPTALAPDGVPWEIHTIANADARQAALNAYWESRL